MAEEEKKPRSSGLYRLARVAGWLMQHTFWPVKYHDVERLQQLDAPYVLIANHHCWRDPLILAVPVKRYEITFLGKKELTKNAFAKWALTGMHMIIVDRHNMDMAAMRACVKTVRDGNILGIFPEGTRHHKGVMEELEDGTALLTMRSGVPLVPVYISAKARAFRTTHVYVGESIPYDDLKAEGVNKETCTRLDERMTQTYRVMQEEHPFRA